MGMRVGPTVFNYYVRDVCIVFLKWSLPFIPFANRHCNEIRNVRRRNFVPVDHSDVASSFVQFLMENTLYPSSPILRSNVQIIKLLLEAWKDSLRLQKVIRSSFSLCVRIFITVSSLECHYGVSDEEGKAKVGATLSSHGYPTVGINAVQRLPSLRWSRRQGVLFCTPPLHPERKSVN
jgi:hypothetical protein